MKNLFLLPLFIVFVFLFTSCVKINTTTEPDNSDNTVKPLMPLKAGNVWVYQKSYYNYNGQKYDTVTWEETWIMINSRQQTWQHNGIWDVVLTAPSYTFLVTKDQNTDTNGLIFTVHNDSLYYGWPSNYETIVTEFIIPDTNFNVYEKYNWGVQYSSTYTAEYSTFNVPYGNLEGYGIYERFGTAKSGEFFIFSPGIGLIWCKTFDWEIKLKSYSLR